MTTLVALAVCGAFPQGADYSSGLRYLRLRVRSGEYHAALWYPSEAPEHPHLYPTSARPGRELRGRCAFEAGPAEGRFPLVLFFHDYGGGALGNSFLCEHLARNGFVVFSPDFHDLAPPFYLRTVASSRIEGEAVPFLRVAATVAILAREMNSDRDRFFRWIESCRLGPAKALLGELEREDSIRRMVDWEKVGVAGHSMGAITGWGLCGAHAGFERDGRIRALVSLSGGPYPFEEGVAKVKLPVMVVYGDNDPPMNRRCPRSLGYERARAPRYLLVLQGTNHLTFANPIAVDANAAAGFDERRVTIRDYTTAFFRRHVLGLSSETLDRAPSSSAVYAHELPEKAEVRWELAQ